MLRPRHGMVDPRRLTSRTFAPLLYAITRQPSSFSSFARARAAEGLGDCHNALRANSIPAGFLACPDVLDHASLGRLVSAHGSDLPPTGPLGGSGMTCPRCQHENRAAARSAARLSGGRKRVPSQPRRMRTCSVRSTWSLVSAFSTSAAVAVPVRREVARCRQPPAPEYTQTYRAHVMRLRRNPGKALDDRPHFFDFGGRP